MSETSNEKIQEVGRNIQDLLKATPILLPPQEEQIEISHYLDKKCATIDTIINEKESEIIELETYKKSFIYEVVTGKRKVVA